MIQNFSLDFLKILWIKSSRKISRERYRDKDIERLTSRERYREKDIKRLISRERYREKDIERLISSERYREKDIERKILRERYRESLENVEASFSGLILFGFVCIADFGKILSSLHGVFKKNVAFRQKWKYLKIKKFDRFYTVSLSRHEQVCLMRLRFEKNFSYWADDGRSISRNVVSLNILVHDMINLLHYEHWKDKQKYF